MNVHNTSRQPCETRPCTQHGVMLLEVLIAVLVFSLGVLAIVKLNAVSARQSTEAEFRSLASLAVNDLVGRIWATDRDPAVLKGKLVGGDIYTQWRDSTLRQSGLPNVNVKAPEVTVEDISATIPNGSRITIKVFWQMPGKDWAEETAPIRQYTVTLTVRPR